MQYKENIGVFINDFEQTLQIALVFLLQNLGLTLLVGSHVSRTQNIPEFKDLQEFSSQNKLKVAIDLKYYFL